VKPRRVIYLKTVKPRGINAFEKDRLPALALSPLNLERGVDGSAGLT
jgi:hypothetical protein